MTYTIENDRFVAKIDDFGAELFSLSGKGNGKEYIWTGDPAYWDRHNPHLFPVLCSLKDNKTHFYGKEYEIPKHGFANNSRFSLSSLEKSRISLSLASSEETKKMYPFDFVFTVTHELTDDGFKTVYTVKNESAREMAFHVGGHTGFLLPFSDGCDFSDLVLKFDAPESAVNYCASTGATIADHVGHRDLIRESDTLKLSYEMFDLDSLILDDLHSGGVAVVDPNGKGVHVDTSGFSCLGVWTPGGGKHAPFICLEPWNGLPAFDDEKPEFFDKPHAVRLMPGKVYETSYTVKFL